MLHLMLQTGEIVSYPQPALVIQAGAGVEVWTRKENGVATQLASHSNPIFRVDCVHEDKTCPCLSDAIERVTPPAAPEAPEVIAQRKLGI